MENAPHGVIPAIPTPFTPDGSEVDVEALRRIVHHVVDGGVHGIMTTGGTGEFPHLSREERRLVTEVVAAEAAGAVTIFAGTSACSTREAIELTADAADVGADAAILVPPYYFGIPDEMLLAHFADIARAGILPVGLKQSEDDLGQLVEALRLAEGSGRNLCTGIDSQFYAALCVGASGIFSTAAAIVPGPTVRLFELVSRGEYDDALAQHRALQPLNRFLEYDPGYVSPTKEALRMLGLDCGPVRRPLPDFPEAERPALRAALAGLGVLDRAAVA
jgi:4-hydroxy-tetrahydrodipicolinate synthase